MVVKLVVGVEFWRTYPVLVLDFIIRLFIWWRLPNFLEGYCGGRNHWLWSLVVFGWRLGTPLL